MEDRFQVEERIVNLVTLLIYANSTIQGSEIQTPFTLILKECTIFAPVKICSN
jgi:hypothetical protein